MNLQSNPYLERQEMILTNKTPYNGRVNLEEPENPDARFQMFERVQVKNKATEYREPLKGDLQDTNLIYKLFAEKNPYFTEYIISKQIYEALINISKNQVYYKDFKDVPFINDLIKKGILILNRYNQSVEVGCDKKKYSNNQDGILEMETKTTPTCLTSYLKQ